MTDLPDAAPPALPSPSAAPGWYPHAGQQRYWNGSQWTEHFAPATISPTFVQVVKVPTNGIAVAGLVMGILAVAFGWWPGIGLLFAWPFMILAIIFGGVGVANSKKLNGLRRQYGWWAIWLGLTPLFISVIAGIITGIVSAANS